MPDFWRDSGFDLLNRRTDGHLEVTEDFLRAYFLRPEVRPVNESCDSERALHEALIRNPKEAVGADRLSALADPDAKDNYRVVLDFRDRLVAAGTVEACYLSLFTENAGVTLPPLFLDQMVQVIVRSFLEPCDDPIRARAGEILFREQKVTLNDGAIMAADAETVEMFAQTGGFGSLGRLVAEAATPLRSVSLDVLDEDNATVYWSRDNHFDTVIALNFTAPGLDALCRVLESWTKHMLDVEVSIQPVQQISDPRWTWHLGLDSEGTRLLNDLYDGKEVSEDRMSGLLSLFRLDFKEQSMVPDAFAGRPVYMALCMTESGNLRLKPQNLLVNLPLAERA